MIAFVWRVTRATLFIALPALVGNLITNATAMGSFDAEKIGLSRLLPISHHAPEMTVARDCAPQNKQIIRFDMASIGWCSRGDLPRASSAALAPVRPSPLVVAGRRRFLLQRARNE
jgi:hypothetical protein